MRVLPTQHETRKYPYLPTGSATLKSKRSEKDVHPKAPRRLVSLWKKTDRSDRKLGDLLEVNHYYVSELLWRGIEPGNPEIREKLFLPRKPRKTREQKPEEWTGQKRVRKNVRMMHRDTTYTFSHYGEIKKEYDHIKKGK